MQTAPAASDRYLILKINTLVPIKHLKLIPNIGNLSGTDISTVEVSSDGINFITISSCIGYTHGIVDTDIVNGASTVYVKLHRGTGIASYFLIYSLKIEADLDTSSLPQPIIYPVGTYGVNQFTEQVVLPSVATRVYFRTSKFANDRGVVVPHLEFTDASGVYIKAIPCKIDNTGETNPAIDIIIADTTYGQQSGTGSADSTTGYILNDGEYMTFSTATAAPKITFRVGGGTTTFANITKNRIYLSSNGSANSATKDPSHQMTVTTWYRVQSVIRGLQDLTQKVSDIAIGGLNLISNSIHVGSSASIADGGTIVHGFGSAPRLVICNATTSAEFASPTTIGASTVTVAIKKHDGTAGTTQTINWIAVM